MKATVLNAAFSIDICEVRDPEIQRSTDAVVKVSHTCVCGSDLWSYRGGVARDRGHPMGHEFIGIVSEVGGNVRTVAVGDAVISPFSWSCGQCRFCRKGLTASCTDAGFWGRSVGAGGAQSELIRVPHADGTLVRVPESALRGIPADLLCLCDVMCTGHHAAVCARVEPGSTVAVVGDGAVGLCAVLAARRLGAEEIVLFGTHESRMALGIEFGATAVIRERGAAAVDTFLESRRGARADAVLECVGTEDSLRTAVQLAEDGGCVGYVGVPHGVEKVFISDMFRRNLSLKGGIAPARHHIEELLPCVLEGRLRPGRVFDLKLPLGEAATAYKAMHERTAIKVMLETHR